MAIARCSRNPEGDVPRNLELRLVPARERFARLGGLELGEEIAVAAGLHAVERRGPGVEAVVELQRQRVGAGRDRRAGGHLDHVRTRLLERHRYGARLARERDLVELELACVEAEALDRLLHLERHLCRARVVGLVGVERQAQRLGGRLDLVPEAKRVVCAGRGGVERKRHEQRGGGQEQGGALRHGRSSWAERMLGERRGQEGWNITRRPPGPSSARAHAPGFSRRARGRLACGPGGRV